MKSAPIKIKDLLQAASLLASKHKMTPDEAYTWLTTHNDRLNAKPISYFNSPASRTVLFFIKELM